MDNGLASSVTDDWTTTARLLAAAAGRTNAELKLLLVRHAPKPDLPTLVPTAPVAA